MFGATIIVNNNDKEKYEYSAYRIAFHGKGSLSFNVDFARNVIIFEVDNNSPFHTDNLKNDYSRIENQSINLWLVIKIVTFHLKYI